MKLPDRFIPDRISIISGRGFFYAADFFYWNIYACARDWKG